MEKAAIRLPFSLWGPEKGLETEARREPASAIRQDAGLVPEAGRREPTGRRRLETKSFLGHNGKGSHQAAFFVVGT